MQRVRWVIALWEGWQCVIIQQRSQVILSTSTCSFVKIKIKKSFSESKVSHVDRTACQNPEEKKKLNDVETLNLPADKRRLQLTFLASWRLSHAIDSQDSNAELSLWDRHCISVSPISVNVPRRPWKCDSYAGISEEAKRQRMRCEGENRQFLDATISLLKHLRRCCQAWTAAPPDVEGYYKGLASVLMPCGQLDEF